MTRAAAEPRGTASWLVLTTSRRHLHATPSKRLAKDSKSPSPYARHPRTGTPCVATRPCLRGTLRPHRPIGPGRASSEAAAEASDRGAVSELQTAGRRCCSEDGAPPVAAVAQAAEALATRASAGSGLAGIPCRPRKKPGRHTVSSAAAVPTDPGRRRQSNPHAHSAHAVIHDHGNGEPSARPRTGGLDRPSTLPNGQ